MKLRRLLPKSGGFTLVELLIVVIILAILAAVVIPQFSNTTSSAKAAALDANLSALRSAIELYYQQHGHYPGSKASTGGTSPVSGGAVGSGAVDTAQAVIDQLTMYTNASGQAVGSTSATSTYTFGPYLKKGVPNEPISNSNAIAVSTAGALDLAVTGTTGGWKYDVKTGNLVANTTESDAHKR